MVTQYNDNDSYSHDNKYKFIVIPRFDVTQDETRRYITQLENNDTQFKQVSNSDFTIDSQNMSTTVAAVTTRQIQSIDSPFNDNFMRVSIPDAYRVDAKAFIERPFYVDEVTFPSTAQRYSLLTNTVRFLPGDIARSNPSVLNMFKMASYGRPDLVLNASMAGTITHAGCVLMGVLPPMPAYPTANKSLINTILTGPHAFLHANEATSIVVPAPWYCNADLATTDMDQTQGYQTTLDITETNGNYATLVFMVLNPLAPSTGSTNSLKIVVEACFKNFDLAVPTPRYVTWLPQSGRKKKNTQTTPELMSFMNINYDEIDRVAREHSLEVWGTMSDVRRRTFISRLRAVAPYVSIGTTLIGLILRLAFSMLAEEENERVFEPQSGIVSAIAGGLSGLLDSTAAGIKKVTGDAIDAGRGLIKDYTGLHNPNVPEIHQRVISSETNFVNYTDTPQFFEKLDPFTKFNRIVSEPIFGSTLDEMAITNIVTKKQFLGTFAVSINDNIGTMKWARPISPFQGGDGLVQANTAIQCYNNLELLHSFSRGWRGGLKLTIQSVMNNKQQCKLRVIKMYNPSVNVTTGYPAYKSIVNAPTHLLEFTQGGQEHEVKLPYLCRNDITPCASNTSFEAMFHGMYYIYVAQPLVVSDSSPNQIEFNIYLSGEDDLTFYGYSTAVTYHSNYGILSNPTSIKASHPVSRTVYDSVRRIRIPKEKIYVDSSNQGLFIKRNVTEYLQRSKSSKTETEINNIVAEITKMIPTLANDKPTPTTATPPPPPLTDIQRLAIDIKEKFDKSNALYQRCIAILGVEKYWELLGKATIDDSSIIEFDTRHLHPWESISMSLIFTPRRFEAQSGNSIKVMNEPQDQSHVTRDDSKEEQLTHMTRLMPSVDIRHFIRRMYKSIVNNVQIDPSGASNSLLPLASILGELPNTWNYTPIETFSRMYYGKTVGFKFRIMITLDRIDQDTVSDIDQLDFRVYYIPQNMNALTGPKLIASALPNLLAVPSPISTASDCIPLPYTVIAKHTTRTSKVFEFVLPDTSFYKFMGSPIKFYNFDGNSNPRIPAQADFGSLIMQFTNLNRQATFSGVIETFVGLTDESRFGYHTMAPPFSVFKTSSLYLGNDASATATIPAAVNPFLYRGGFL